MNDFDQLVADTLAKILEFGIKNKTVIKTFKRDCKKLGMYLTKTGVRFSLDTGLQWITANQPPPKCSHTCFTINPVPLKFKKYIRKGGAYQ